MCPFIIYLFDSFCIVKLKCFSGQIIKFHYGKRGIVGKMCSLWLLDPCVPRGTPWRGMRNLAYVYMEDMQCDIY